MEPIGNREIRRQLAFIASTLFNHWRAKDAEPTSAEDFLFKLPEQEQERQVEAAGLKKQNMITALHALAIATGGRTPRRRKARRRT